MLWDEQWLNILAKQRSINEHQMKVNGNHINGGGGAHGHSSAYVVLDRWGTMTKQQGSLGGNRSLGEFVGFGRWNGLCFPCVHANIYASRG